MAKSLDKLGIMNMMGKAAHMKAQKPSAKNPDPDMDGDDDRTPEGDTDHDFKPKAKQAAMINKKKLSK